MRKEEKLPAIIIKRIKETAFFIQEALITQNNEKIIKIEIDQQFGFSFEYNMVELTIRIYYFHPEDAKNLLAEIKVQNIYEIPDLKQFQLNEAEIKLPGKMITAIVSASISHTRALLAQRLAGTSLQSSLPRLVDPEDVARYFFPRMFDDQLTEPAA